MERRTFLGSVALAAAGGRLAIAEGGVVATVVTLRLKLAGLVEGTRREYLPAVRQLATYYMASPDRFAAPFPAI